MYALRRTIVAFLLGAALFGAPLALATDITGDLNLNLYGGNTSDGTNPGNVSIGGGYALLDAQGVGGSVDLLGGFNQGGGSPAEVFVTGSQGLNGGYLALFSGNGYGADGGNIELYLGTPNGLLIVRNLPTTDPHVQGALYRLSNGTVKVSAG